MFVFICYCSQCDQGVCLLHKLISQSQKRDSLGTACSLEMLYLIFLDSQIRFWSLVVYLLWGFFLIDGNVCYSCLVFVLQRYRFFCQFFFNSWIFYLWVTCFFSLIFLKSYMWGFVEYLHDIIYYVFIIWLYNTYLHNQTDSTGRAVCWGCGAELLTCYNTLWLCSCV